jgi:hypothetical protein
MGRIILSICAVVVAAGLGALAEQPDNAARGNGSPAAAEDQKDRKAGQVPAAVEQSPRPDVALDKRENPKDESESPYTARDIIAQETMADASNLMAWAAIGTMLVTIVGTGLIAWQVRLTRKAVKDTSNATGAMVRQNDLAERAQRPWLSIEITFLESSAGGSLSNHWLNHDIKVHNSGATPALVGPPLVEHVFPGADGRDDIERFRSRLARACHSDFPMSRVVAPKADVTFSRHSTPIRFEPRPDLEPPVKISCMLWVGVAYRSVDSPVVFATIKKISADIKVSAADEEIEFFEHKTLMF